MLQILRYFCLVFESCSRSPSSVHDKHSPLSAYILSFYDKKCLWLHYVYIIPVFHVNMLKVVQILLLPLPKNTLSSTP